MQTRRLELFTTIQTEGAILPVDILQRILDGDSAIEGTSPDSYHLGAGEKINEAVNRSWNRLQGLWLSFQNAREKLPATDTGTSLTRDKWLLQLFQELGYGRLQTGKAIEHDNKLYAISHQWKHTLIHLVSFKLDLDKRQKGATGASKASPHSLMQELLNASDEHLWGFVSNGLQLRILRDSRSLTRQSYVEFDIEGMMNGEVYSDFVLLWMLCHQSRVEADKPEECWLEKWSQTAQEQGTRALDQLRNGVEQAIKELGQGFLSHPSNTKLRELLKTGLLPTQDYYRQLFRLVYRLLFLFVAEDRDLLLHPKADPVNRERYNKHYSLTRLRRMASKLRGSKHDDAWEQVRIIMDILSGDSGYEALGLPALGGYLFSDEAIPDLHDCGITNHDFLTAVRALAFIVDKGTLRPVDYKNLRSEEFGSVYESLLELHPVINADAGTFELKTAGGNERKTTASYYTHDSLVQCLLDSALDPVVDEACKKPDPEKAILALKVCDFASGSGHFLTAAAHRMAKRLAAIRTEEEEPAPDAVRTALRDVIGHCIYGVDINPMAVELCKVALWMEALEAGKPLSFLDHHIQCGNSLIGATPALLKQGIPDEAFTPIEGDDKKVCQEYKKRNKQEREKAQTTLFDMESKPWMHLGNLTTALMDIDSISDDTVDGVKKKKKKYEEFVTSTGSLFGKFLADIWCASFVWKKTNEFPYPITEEVFRNIEKNPFSAPIWLKEEVERLAKEYQFFHWQLVFPDVFYVDAEPENEQAGWSGGFDVLLGNPPWERVKMQEKEWLAVNYPEVASNRNLNVRKSYIEDLLRDDPSFAHYFQSAKRFSENISRFIIDSGSFPLCGRGDVNLYSVFSEIGISLLSVDGRFGCIVPTGIATDDTTKYFFQTIMKNKNLISLYDYENRERVLFPDVYYRMRFCLMTCKSTKNINSVEPVFCFLGLRSDDYKNPAKRFTLTAKEIEVINPITKTCPTFRTLKEANICKNIYHRMPVLGEKTHQNTEGWNLLIAQGLYHQAGDAKHFHDSRKLIRDGYIRDRVMRLTKDDDTFHRLYEGKMIHLFNHRAGSAGEADLNLQRTGTKVETTEDQYHDPWYFVDTRHYVNAGETEKRMPSEYGRQWFIAMKDVTSATNERTVIACIVPRTAVVHSIKVIFPIANCIADVCCLLASWNSMCFDFVAGQKSTGNHLSDYILRQLPLPEPASYRDAKSLHNASGTTNKAGIRHWIMPRVLELTYTAWDLQPFAQDCGYNGAPFKWDEERRFLLRAELDAAYFHLYGIERDDVDYIMETFPIVKRRDEVKHGEYRTKRVILEMYDQMKEAMDSGGTYQTRLDPPPADERVAHPMKGK